MRRKRSVDQLPITEEEEVTFDPWIDFRPEPKMLMFMCLFLLLQIPIILYTLYYIYKIDLIDTNIIFNIVYYSIDREKVLTLLNRTYLK